MGKQLFLDIVIVLSVPIIIIGGYFFWFRDSNEALLSASSAMLKTSTDAPGARTKIALETLRTITLSDNLFKDQAFLSLRRYTVEIPTSPISRDYPFTPPAVIADMQRRAKANPASTGSKAESISVKLDMLKSSTAR